MSAKSRIQTAIKAVCTFIAAAVLAALISGTLPARRAQADPSTWSDTGWLTDSRGGHSATLLPDGRVLAAGGYDRTSGYRASAEVYDPATGDWTSTSNLDTSRSGHTSTLLPDGRVLIVGGYTMANFVEIYPTSAELYDPVTGAFTLAGSLNHGRAYHTATLLRDGRVVVVGGYYKPVVGDELYLSTVELYDPTTGTFTTTDDLAYGRAFHTATLLPDGGVLVVGGYNKPALGIGQYWSTAETYDPTSGLWATATDTLSEGRRDHTATLLASGEVLMAGGYDGSYLSSAELYSPTTSTFSGTGSLGTSRSHHSATLLPSGRVLVAGGSDGSALSGAELYDPPGGTWSPTDSLTPGREGHTATLLASGQVLVAGGTNGTSYYTSTKLYEPPAGAWQEAAPEPIGGMQSARSRHTVTLLPNGTVLAAGGSSRTEHWDTTEIFVPLTGSWTPAEPMGTRRLDHTATLLADGRVLVAGGRYYGSTSWVYLESAEKYDPGEDHWTPTGSMYEARHDHTATLLADGRVLVAGGYAADTYHNTAEIYDPKTGSWDHTGQMAYGVKDHTATLLRDGRVLRTGGTPSTNYRSAEIFDPATEDWTLATSMAISRSLHTATLLADGRVLVVGGYYRVGSTSYYISTAEVYDPASNTWSGSGTLTHERARHTATLQPDGRVLVAGGVNNVAYISNSEVFDPSTSTWSDAGNLTLARLGHAATLLPDGRVLVAGGYASGATYLTSTNVYERGLGYQPSWRPQLTSAISPLLPGFPLQARGRGFRGLSEGSGGTSQNSATNYPLVQLRRVDNEQIRWFLPERGSFSDVAFTSTFDTDFPVGFALVTVFANAIPSESALVAVEPPPGSYLPLVSKD